MYTLTLPVRRGVLGDLSSPPAKCAREPQLQETAARVALIGAENAPYGTVSRDTAWSTASISVTARLRRLGDRPMAANILQAFQCLFGSVGNHIPTVLSICANIQVQ